MAKFHNNRKKDGRSKMFTPEELQELFEEYKEHVKNNPFLIHEFVGKDGTSVMRSKERPLTKDGFELFVRQKGKAKGLDQYIYNQNGAYNDFMGFLKDFDLEIRDNQLSGAMAGIFNPTITARMNNLTESTKQEHDGKIEVVFVDNKTIL